MRSAAAAASLLIGVGRLNRTWRPFAAADPLTACGRKRTGPLIATFDSDNRHRCQHFHLSATAGLQLLRPQCRFSNRLRRTTYRQLTADKSSWIGTYSSAAPGVAVCSGSQGGLKLPLEIGAGAGFDVTLRGISTAVQKRCFHKCWLCPHAFRQAPMRHQACTGTGGFPTAQVLREKASKWNPCLASVATRLLRRAALRQFIV
jgi:hypothetical protein